MLIRALLLWTALAAADVVADNAASKDNNVAPGSKGLVAEWQWEAWSLPNGTRGPGPRAGAALWLDRAAGCWWLFGGRLAPGAGAAGPPKAYSDLWRYDPAERRWARVFPADGRRSGPKGMLLLRSSLQESDSAGSAGGGEGGGGADGAAGAAGADKAAVEASPALLCGRADPQDPMKRSLAYYDPRNRRSNTVWQLELSDRVWTAYMCCCDRTDASAAAAAHADTPPERAGTLKTQAEGARPAPAVRHGVVRTHEAAADAEEEAEEEERREEREEQAARHGAAASTRAASDAPPTSAASRLTTEAPSTDAPAAPVTSPTPVERASTPSAPPTPSTASPRPRPSPPPSAAPTQQTPTPTPTPTTARSPANDSETTSQDEPTLPPPQKPTRDKAGSKTISKPSENKSKSPRGPPCCGGAGAGAGAPGGGAGEDEGAARAAAPAGAAGAAGDADAFCPDFETGGGSQPIAWCDSARDQLLAMDLHAAPLALWQFDLATSHWSRHQVAVRNGSLWPGCAADAAAVRYASAGSSVLVLCAPYGAGAPTATRLVYRLEASPAGAGAALRAVGQLQLDAALADAALWADDARSALAAAPAGAGRTLLMLAHGKVVNLWLLHEPEGDAPRVEPIENVWPGNALKWFREYSAPLYNLQVEGQTWLLPNPRPVEGYWATERGRFVVTLRPRDEAARHVLEEARAAARDASNAQAHGAPSGGAGGGAGAGGVAHDGLKALLFFAFSLTIFAVFGVVVFVRRCVTCPGRRGGAAGGGAGSSWCGGRGDEAGKAAPPVIRYSVIPDDLAYPKA